MRVCVGGGGGWTRGSKPTASRTPFSRPLLCFSRLQVNLKDQRPRFSVTAVPFCTENFNSLFMCHVISIMTNDVNDLKRFPISPKLILFLARVRIYVFSRIKFCLKPRITLLVCVFDWIISSNK